MTSGATTMKWLKRFNICLVLLALMQSPLVSAFGIPAFLEFGECANTKVQANLDLNRYSGVWFAQEMVPNEYSQIAECSMTNYTFKGDFMNVVERGLTTGGKKVRQNSIIRKNDEGKEGAMTVDAEGVPSAPYEIVATDYENYACVYSCMSFMGFRAAFSWIYTRKPTPDHSYVVLCREILAGQGVDPNPLKPVKQGKDCPYMEKLDQILAHTEMVLGSNKQANEIPDKSKTPKKTVSEHADDTVSEVDETLTELLDEPMPEHNQKSKPQHVDATNVEEMETLADLERELRDEEDHLLSAMEEERRLAEQERRRMEEEEKRAQEEVRKMEEERMRMEAERARLEEERAIMAEEIRDEKEEMKELRAQIRTEIKRIHRGSKHREGHDFTYEENSSNNLRNSIVTILLSACLSVGVALL